MIFLVNSRKIITFYFAFTKKKYFSAKCVLFFLVLGYALNKMRSNVTNVPVNTI